MRLDAKEIPREEPTAPSPPATAAEADTTVAAMVGIVTVKLSATRVITYEEPVILSVTDHSLPSVRTVTARAPVFMMLWVVKSPDRVPRKVLSRPISITCSSSPVPSSSTSVEAASFRLMAKRSASPTIRFSRGGLADRLSAVIVTSPLLSRALFSTYALVLVRIIFVACAPAPLIEAPITPAATASAAAEETAFIWDCSTACTPILPIVELTELLIIKAATSLAIVL